MKTIICALFATLVVVLVESAFLFNGDTIVIDAKQSLSTREKRHAQVVDSVINYGYDSVVVSTGCSTMRGKQGTCRKVQECYPFLFPLNKTQPSSFYNEPSANNELINILIETSGICDFPQNMKPRQNIKQVLESQFLICCPDPMSKFSIDIPTPPPISEDIALPPILEGLETYKEQQEQLICSSKTPVLEPTEKDEMPQNATASNKTASGDRIVGGTEASPGDFPWIVALMNRNKQFCGGSLIMKDWVLTAAHCIQHMSSSDIATLQIIVGDHDVYNPNDVPIQKRSASRILYHKDFSMQNLKNDIGLIKLSSPVQYTKNVKPICLHSGNSSITGLQGDLAGWFVTLCPAGQICEGCSQPSKLRKAKLIMLSHEECKKAYSGIIQITEGMLCSGGKGMGNSCRGDSGGGLTINSKTNGEQIGLVSFGVECGGKPGVFTKVSHYLPWITRNIQKFKTA